MIRAAREQPGARLRRSEVALRHAHGQRRHVQREGLCKQRRVLRQELRLRGSELLRQPGPPGVVGGCEDGAAGDAEAGCADAGDGLGGRGGAARDGRSVGRGGREAMSGYGSK